MPIKSSPEGKITLRFSEGSQRDLREFILLNTPFEEGVAGESVEGLTERFERLSENKIVFASTDECVVGYMAYSVWPNTEVAEVRDYKIAPYFDETGILNAMLTQAQDDARKCGVKHIQVIVNSKERARYEQMGFSKAEPGTPGEMQRRTDS
jgi:N-acetylglutamate synthase-like GNAT family acetyltransferase